jgi:hypothetical protein
MDQLYYWLDYHLPLSLLGLILPVILGITLMLWLAGLYPFLQKGELPPWLTQRWLTRRR